MRFILTIAAIVATSVCPMGAIAQDYTKPVGDITSRVQTNLNRVAHGIPAFDGDKATTSVDRLVEIFSDLLNGTSQQQADARELLDDLQRSIEVSFDARQINEPFPHLAKAMEDVKRRAKEEETLSPIDMAWKKVVIVAYQALLLESYDHWSSWRNDLRGTIRLPCSITDRLKGPLEFSSPHLRATLGEVTTCPLIGRFRPHERRLVTEDELILLVEMQRDVVEERQRSGEVDPAVPGFPFDEIVAYRQAVRNVEGNWGGSSANGIYAALDERKHALMANPQEYSGSAAVPPQIYRTWSYMSLRNHALITKVDRLAAQTRAKLVPYFIGKGVDSSQAENAVSRGLASITLGGKCGDNIVPRSFRSLLLDGASLIEITEFAESGAWRHADQLLPFQSCAFFADMDPLAHIAVVDVRSFEYLRSIAASLPADDRTALDLVLDIDARNEFGKTPLMTAAQFNKLDAVKWLLANGVAVNARTDAEGLGHGRRTPLMYAAASGSVEVIRTLLEAGADPYLADTTGQSAIDYLVGVTYEREPPNPVLAEEELKLAYKLLR